MACNIQKELSGIDLGDERRDRRIARLAARLAAAPALSISGACDGWAETKAGYRLARSAAVSAQKVLAPHRAATLERARASGEDLLLVQDTTELDYSTHKALEGVGPLSSQNRRGFFLHNHLLIAEDSGTSLGLCGAQIFTRSDAEHGKAKRSHQRPIEEKESMRWMHGYAEACAVARSLPDQRVVMLADREADIYELFAEHHRLASAKRGQAELIIRAKYDRVLGDTTLFAAAEAAPLWGTYELAVVAQLQMKKTPVGPRPRQRAERKQARMEVRVTRVKLSPPKRPSGRKLPEVELTLISAREKDPPAGEPPICWLLFTTLPVENFTAALRVLRAYGLRWRVEEFHRILKTGCRVEALSFAEAGSIHTLLALYLLVAWRILYLRDFARAAPDQPASDFFTEAEWKSACLMRKRPLERAPPLGELLLIVAGFGGYSKRSKNDPPPGPERLWRGLIKLQHYAEMAALLRAI